MNTKIIAVLVGVLALGSVVFFRVTNNNANKAPFDFGDAPDGKVNMYFPSLLKSNGARAKNTDDVWLGQEVTAEKDSKQVNVDEADDGVKLDVRSCEKSTAYFFVHLTNFENVAGTAYLNLYADWNSDGKWAGSDACASEWAVRNFPVDLGKQRQEVAVYAPEFTAGKNIEDFWYRGTVSVNEQMNEAATGEFEKGEVEDYEIKEPYDWSYYGFFCKPDPLTIKHGSKGDITIMPVLFSEPIRAVEFGQNYNPKDDKRNVSINGSVITYASSAKDVDPPKRSVPHNVDIKVSFGRGSTEAILGGQCAVAVEHDEITIETPSEKTPRRGAFPSPTTIPESVPHVEEKAPGLMGY